MPKPRKEFGVNIFLRESESLNNNIEESIFLKYISNCIEFSIARFPKYLSYS